MFAGVASPESCPALVLNADFHPLSYYPLSLWSWEDAVRAVCRESVTVLAEYDRVVRSPSCSMRLPSVLALKEFVAAGAAPAFTRFNVFLRDGWRCQYCGIRYKTHQLTFDHVVPRSRGGRTSWDNIVTACRPCNTRKGRFLPHECHMYPLDEAVRPTLHALNRQGRRFPPGFLHQSWHDYLYWDSELEA